MQPLKQTNKKPPNLLSTWRSPFAPQSATHTSYRINQILSNKTSRLSSRPFSWSRSIKKVPLKKVFSCEKGKKESSAVGCCVLLPSDRERTDAY